MYTDIDCSNYTFKNKASLEVYDITGKVIEGLKSTVEEKRIILERSGLIPGLYFYKLYDGETVLGIGKIIIHSR